MYSYTILNILLVGTQWMEEKRSKVPKEFRKNVNSKLINLANETYSLNFGKQKKIKYFYWSLILSSLVDYMTNYWTGYITFFISVSLLHVWISSFLIWLTGIIELDFEKIMNIDYFHSYIAWNRKRFK